MGPVKNPILELTYLTRSGAIRHEAELTAYRRFGASFRSPRRSSCLTVWSSSPR